MSQQRGFQLLALSVLTSAAISGCSRDLTLSPPPLEIASVELVPIGSDSVDVCRIAVGVRNPGSNELTDQFDDDEIAMSIELRAVSALGLDYGIDAGAKTVPSGETVEFSPPDTILGADVYFVYHHADARRRAGDYRTGCGRS
jgi:hypothetical protein